MAGQSPLTRSIEDRRELAAWAVACVERVLPLFTAARPDDDRLTRALAGARAFARGELTVPSTRELALDCHAAAREAGDPAAVAVARACGQALGVAQVAGHAQTVPRYTLRAVELADPGAVAREDAWQRERLPERYHAFVYPAAPRPAASPGREAV